MKRVIIPSIIILLAITIGFWLIRLDSRRAPKKLIPKFIFGKEGKGLGEFRAPRSLAIKEDYLFVGELDNNRIQILKINPDGNLSPKFAFGREGKGLGEFGGLLTSLILRKNILYVVDADNHCIQVLEIKY